MCNKLAQRAKIGNKLACQNWQAIHVRILARRVPKLARNSRAKIGKKLACENWQEISVRKLARNWLAKIGTKFLCRN
jgi:hypothetical protein